MSDEDRLDVDPLDEPVDDGTGITDSDTDADGDSSAAVIDMQEEPGHPGGGDTA